MMEIRFELNGRPVTAEIPAGRILVDLLREDLGLTGTKVNCRLGECGSCTVLLDGVNVLSCLTLAAQVDGHAVRTIEGLASSGELHPVQEAFIERHAFQCGYCTPGMIMSAVALLEAGEPVDEAAIRSGMVGNLCRCTGYHQIVEAIEAAADEMRHNRPPG